jgi:hypothetical protein
MVVYVHVKDSGGLAVDCPKELPKGAAANARTHAIVVEVIIVRDRMPRFAEEERPSVAQCGNTAGHETHAFGRKGMGPQEIVTDLLEKGLE